MIALAVIVAMVAVVVALYGVAAIVGESLTQRSLISQVGAAQESRLQRARRAADAMLMRTRLGQMLSVGVDELGFARLRAIDAVLVILAAMLLVVVLVGTFLSWLLAPLLALLVPPAAYLWVRREQQRRKERFIGQMPQLARVLSNATDAGLALRTAIELAADELGEPASSEMARVAQSMAVGQSVEEALSMLEQRLPSREVVVLVSTLIVSSRAGGALITSLRRIAETLEERKQTRREIQTMLSEARSTAFLIPVVGVMSLLMLRQINDDAIDMLLSDPVGQLIFIVAIVMYAVGFFLFNRVTRVEP